MLGGERDVPGRPHDSTRTSRPAATIPRLQRPQLPARTVAGALAYDEGDRTGALQATSPNAAFTVLITLEKEAGPASPSGKSILSQSVAARG